MAEASMKVQMNLLEVLVRQCQKDSSEWFPEAANSATEDPAEWRRAAIHHALALCGEAGEVANWIKKLDRGSYDPTNIVFQSEVREELVDVFVYLLNLAGLFKLDLLKGYLAKRDKNAKRFTKNGSVDV